MKKLILLGAIAFGVAWLSGCSGSSGGSSSTTTSAATCNYNGTTYINSSSGAACNCINNGSGTSTDSISGAICSGTGVGGTGIGSCTLSVSGQYINPLTGQLCSTSGSSCVLTPQGYYISPTTGQICQTQGYGGISGGSYTGGCNYWTQIYGVLYEPAYLNGQLICVQVL